MPTPTSECKVDVMCRQMTGAWLPTHPYITISLQDIQNPVPYNT